MLIIQNLADKRSRNAIFMTIAVVLTLLLIGFLSPIGVFFAATDLGEGKTIQVIVNELQDELNDKIEKEKVGADVYTVEYVGSEDERPIINSQDVIAVFSVRAGMDKYDPKVVFALTDELVDLLKQTFWDMNTISSTIATDKPKPAEDNEDEPLSSQTPEPSSDASSQKMRKTISIDCKTYEEMIDVYSFDDEQTVMLNELMSPDYADLFLPRAMGKALTHQLTPTEISDIQLMLPDGLSVQRERVVKAALTLKGRVHYFWAGKSTAIGWDHRWGELRTVTAGGSKSTGTDRPFGLDCSGFTRWAMVNGGVPKDKVDKVFGLGSWDQWETSTTVSESQALPGDLAFLAVPGTRKINHVGLVAGRDEKGNILIVHCASSPNNVVLTGKGKIFHFFRRPAVYKDEGEKK